MPDDPNWYNSGGATGDPVVMAPFIVTGNGFETPSYSPAGTGGSGLSNFFAGIGSVVSGALNQVGAGLAQKVNDKVTSAVNGGRAPSNDQYANPTANNTQTTAASNPSVVPGVSNSALVIGGAVVAVGVGALIYLAAKK